MGKTGDAKKTIKESFSAHQVVSSDKSNKLSSSQWLGQIYNKSFVEIIISDFDNVTIDVVEKRNRATIIGAITKDKDQYKFQGKVSNLSGFKSYSPDDLYFSFSSDGFHIEGKAVDPKHKSSGSFWAVRIK